MVGGAAGNAAVHAIAPAIFGTPVTVPAPGEYVALGAARQAAWALGGSAEPPTWASANAETYEAEPTPPVREAYARLRDRTIPWSDTTSQK